MSIRQDAFFAGHRHLPGKALQAVNSSKQTAKKRGMIDIDEKTELSCTNHGRYRCLCLRSSNSFERMLNLVFSVLVLVVFLSRYVAPMVSTTLTPVFFLFLIATSALVVVFDPYALDIVGLL